MNINVPLLLLTSIALLKDFFILPAYINVALHLISCLAALASDKAVYSYYASIPDGKQNVQTYILKLLSLWSSVTVVAFNGSAIALEFSDHLEPVFIAYPNLVCSVLRSGETLAEMLIVLSTIIETFKAFIVYNSLTFMDLNHEKIYKIFLCLTISLFVSQNAFLMIYVGTVCPKTKLKRLSKVHGIKVSDEIQNKHAPPIFLFYIMMLILSSVFLRIMKYKKRRQHSKVVPFKSPDFPSSNDIRIFQTRELGPKSLELKRGSIFTLSPLRYDLEIEKHLNRTLPIKRENRSSVELSSEILHQGEPIIVLDVEDIVVNVATVNEDAFNHQNKLTTDGSVNSSQFLEVQQDNKHFLKQSVHKVDIDFKEDKNSSGKDLLIVIYHKGFWKSPYQCNKLILTKLIQFATDRN